MPDIFQVPKRISGVTTCLQKEKKIWFAFALSDTNQDLKARSHQKHTSAAERIKIAGRTAWGYNTEIYVNYNRISH